MSISLIHGVPDESRLLFRLARLIKRENRLQSEIKIRGSHARPAPSSAIRHRTGPGGGWRAVGGCAEHTQDDDACSHPYSPLRDPSPHASDAERALGLSGVGLRGDEQGLAGDEQGRA